MEAFKFAATVLAVIVGCLIFSAAITEGPGYFSLVDEECRGAQEQYYRARDIALSKKNQIPPAEDKQAAEAHDHADVCAQHRMANAAEWGLFVLFLSLVFAGFAAVMAGRTVQTMRDTSTQELRAYVFARPGEFRIEPDGTLSFIQLHLKNYGQTPAQAISAATFHAIRMPPLPVRAALDSPAPPPTTIGLGPGTEVGIKHRIDRGITPDERRRLTSGERLYFFAIIYYRDVFREERYTRTCFSFDGTMLVAAIDAAVAGRPFASFDFDSDREHNDWT